MSDLLRMVDNEEHRKVSKKFTKINGTVNEESFILVDKTRIVCILKQSQLVPKQSGNILIDAAKEPDYEEIPMLIIDGKAYPFHKKEDRDLAFETLTK